MNDLLSTDKVIRMGLVFGISFLGYFAVRGPLESPRPAIEPPDQPAAIRHEDVEARLWQDPFYPTASHDYEMMAHSDGDDHHGAEYLKEQIAEHIKSVAVLVLPVMVPEAPYPEDVESRKRSRYAVISALHMQNYHPASSSHIGYVRMDWPPKPDSEDAKAEDAADAENHSESLTVLSAQRQLAGWHPTSESATQNGREGKQDPNRTESILVPFEWFKHSGRSDRVLVLWVAEAIATAWPLRDAECEEVQLRDIPFRRLCQLLHTLLPSNEHPVLNEHSASNLQVRIIGPASSTTLKLMAQESVSYCPQREQTCAPAGTDAHLLDNDLLTAWNTRFYSPRATMDEEELEPPRKTTSNHSSDCEVCESLNPQTSRYQFHSGRGDVDLIRTIHTDKHVLRALIEELSRRGVGAADAKHHVVLLSESDTHFGRALPQVFSKLAGAGKGNIHCFTYLRGIDGQLPGMQPEVAVRGQQSRPYNTILPGELRRPSEAAAGRGQLDYLQRMAQSLKRLDRDLRRGKPPPPAPGCGVPKFARDQVESKTPGSARLRPAGRIHAIGVLGSDVYDKILVIKALRAEFPDAVFFTTDMDAIFDDTAENTSMCNLIIGSTFGLSLAPYWQGEIPPFRTTYQSSTYLAIRLALMDAEKPDDFTRAMSEPNAMMPAPNWPHQATPEWLGPPRLFEIGLRGHVDLTPIRVVPPNDSTWHLHPQRSISANRAGVLVAIAVYLIAVLLLLLLLAWWVIEYLNTPSENYLRLASRSPLLEPFGVTAAALLGGLGFAWLLLIRYNEFNGAGKPAFAINGISPCISDGLHFAAGLVGLALTVRCLMSHGAVQEKLLADLDELTREVEIPEGDAKTSTAVPSKLLKAFEGINAKFNRLRTHWIWSRPLVCCAVGFLLLVLTFIIALAFNRWMFGGRPILVPQRGTGAESMLRWTLWGFGLIGTSLLVVCTSFVMIRCGQLSRRVLMLAAELQKEYFDKGDAALKAHETVMKIPDLTRPVAVLVIYPLFALTLLMIARLPLFDRWGWPPVLISTLVVLAVIPVLASIILHAFANSGRADVVEEMSKEKLFPRRAIDQVKKINGGAFGPLWQDPVVEATLIPAGLAALIMILIQWAPTF